MTSPQPRTRHELRCFCRTEPILAMYGVDDEGNLYLHVKAFKQRRIFAEVIVNAPARVKLHCRECLRWQNVIMRPPTQVALEEVQSPGFLAS